MLHKEPRQLAGFFAYGHRWAQADQTDILTTCTHSTKLNLSGVASLLALAFTTLALTALLLSLHQQLLEYLQKIVPPYPLGDTGALASFSLGRSGIFDTLAAKIAKALRRR